MTKLTHTAPQVRDFSATERRALLRKGIAIIGVQHVCSLYGGETGYCLNDNGTHKIRIWREVRDIAAS